MISADQLVLHALGDYVLQSDWMASQKTKRWVPTLAHVGVYALPFLLLTQSPAALLFIAGTHAVIDHWRLARFVCYVKNYLAPPETWTQERNVAAGGMVFYVPKREARWWLPWSECKATGYHADRPVWLATWLMIITDNLMHVVLNGVAIRWL